MWIRFQGNWIQHNNCCFQKNTNGLPSDGKSFENDWIWKFWNEFLHTVFHYFAEKGASSLVLITLRHLNYGNALDVDSKHWYFKLKVDEFRWKIHKKKDGKGQHGFEHSKTTCGHPIYDPLISGRRYEQSEVIDDKICGPDIWKLLMTSFIYTFISWD